MSIEDELNLHNATVVYRRLSGNNKGFVIANMDGYIIVVNSCLGEDEQRETVLHELEHIKRGDLFNMDYMEYAY